MAISIPVATAIMAVLGSLALSANAAERPMLAPAIDVVVTYKLSGSLKRDASKVAISYHNSSHEIRIDLYHFPDSNETFGSTLIDRDKKRVTLLFPDRKGFAYIPPGDAPNFAFMLNDQMKFRIVGYDTIAGRPCTNWSVGPQSAEATACITKDGVLLRAVRAGARGGEMEAISVVYGPLPDTTFLPPDDYRKFVRVPVRDPLAAPSAEGVSGETAPTGTPSAPVPTK